MTTMGERIKRRRKEISLTQSELAERLGYTGKAAISRIERGENNFPLNSIEAWEKALHTTRDYLLSKSDMNDLNGQSFTWTARDNAMNKIDAGDTVKLDKTSAAQSGDLVLADVNGAIVMRRLIQKDGVTMLRADNPDYEDFFNPKFQILGIAVSVEKVLH